MNDFKLEEPIEIIGIRAFARLPEVGAKHASIQDAIDAGRIFGDAVVQTKQGRKLRKELALQQWSACHQTKTDDIPDIQLQSSSSDEVQWGREKTKEEALLARSRRKKIDLETDEYEGKLHRDDDVELVWMDILGRCRSRLLGMPAKLAPIIVAANASKPAEVQALIEREVREALTELASYDKGKIKAQREKRVAKGG